MIWTGNAVMKCDFHGPDGVACDAKCEVDLALNSIGAQEGFWPTDQKWQVAPLGGPGGVLLSYCEKHHQKAEPMSKLIKPAGVAPGMQLGPAGLRPINGRSH